MPQVTIWRMRIACWIPITTDTNSGYVVLTAFPLQQCLHGGTSMLRYAYIACLVLFVQSIKLDAGHTSRSVKLASLLHLVPRLRMIGVTLPLHHTLHGVYGLF